MKYTVSITEDIETGSDYPLEAEAVQEFVRLLATTRPKHVYVTPHTKGGTTFYRVDPNGDVTQIA